MATATQSKTAEPIVDTEAVQHQFIEGVKQANQSAIDALSSWAESVAKYAPNAAFFPAPKDLQAAADAWFKMMTIAPWYIRWISWFGYWKPTRWLASKVYYVIANNAPSEVWHYPDSDKWGFDLPNGQSVYFRKSEVDYYDREE